MDERWLRNEAIETVILVSKTHFTVQTRVKKRDFRLLPFLLIKKLNTSCRCCFFVSVKVMERKWDKHKFNFDSVPSAFLALFSSSTGEGWPL